MNCGHDDHNCFNTQPPEGGWSRATKTAKASISFNTQPPEGGWIQPHIARHAARRFNTQPPEGGWASNRKVSDDCLWFQHTAARRRLGIALRFLITCLYVSTHSRPKAAGQNQLHLSHVCLVSTHSRPKAAGPPLEHAGNQRVVSTHSRPKAAGVVSCSSCFLFVSFNTQPPEGGWGTKTPPQA